MQKFSISLDTYLSPSHRWWRRRVSGCEESVNVKNTWNNIGPKNKFHLYRIDILLHEKYQKLEEGGKKLLK